MKRNIPIKFKEQSLINKLNENVRKNENPHVGVDTSDFNDESVKISYERDPVTGRFKPRSNNNFKKAFDKNTTDKIAKQLSDNDDAHLIQHIEKDNASGEYYTKSIERLKNDIDEGEQSGISTVENIEDVNTIKSICKKGLREAKKLKDSLDKHNIPYTSEIVESDAPYVMDGVQKMEDEQRIVDFKNEGDYIRTLSEKDVDEIEEVFPDNIEDNAYSRNPSKEELDKYINSYNDYVKNKLKPTLDSVKKLRTNLKQHEEKSLKFITNPDDESIINYDFVNHPKHYIKYGVEVIEMMEKLFGIKPTINFCVLSAFKYRMRAGEKPNQSVQQDLDKENFYLNYAKFLTDKL